MAADVGTGTPCMIWLLRLAPRHAWLLAPKGLCASLPRGIRRAGAGAPRRAPCLIGHSPFGRTLPELHTLPPCTDERREALARRHAAAAHTPSTGAHGAQGGTRARTHQRAPLPDRVRGRGSDSGTRRPLRHKACTQLAPAHGRDRRAPVRMSAPVQLHHQRQSERSAPDSRASRA